MKYICSALECYKEKPDKQCYLNACRNLGITIDNELDLNKLNSKEKAKAK